MSMRTNLEVLSSFNLIITTIITSIGERKCQRERVNAREREGASAPEIPSRPEERRSQIRPKGRAQAHSA